MKRLLAIGAVLLIPLAVMAGLYEFDTGQLNTKLSTAAAAAAGHVTDVFYVPDEGGILVDEKVTDIRGWMTFKTDSGFYKVDTAIITFQYMYEGAWTACDAAIDTLNSPDEIYAGATLGLNDVCSGYPLLSYKIFFSDRYRWKIDLRHDSVATVSYVNYRLYGLNVSDPDSV